MNESIYFLSQRSITSYDILTKRFRKLRDLRGGSHWGFYACYFMGKIYIFINNNRSSTVSNPTTNGFDEIAMMRLARQLASCGGRIIVSGGAEGVDTRISLIQAL